MTKDSGIKIVYIVILLLLLTFLFVNKDGLIKYFELKTEIIEMDQKIEFTKSKIEKLSLEIDSLQNSDIKIEKVARDKYRMKYENEVPVRINKE
jgi:cell division protein FtsB